MRPERVFPPSEPSSPRIYEKGAGLMNTASEAISDPKGFAAAKFEELKVSGVLPSPCRVGIAILNLTESEDFSTDELVDSGRCEVT